MGELQKVHFHLENRLGEQTTTFVPNGTDLFENENERDLCSFFMRTCSFPAFC